MSRNDNHVRRFFECGYPRRNWDPGKAVSGGAKTGDIALGRFGDEIGETVSSAQIAKQHDPDALVGRPVAAVVNFLPRQIGKSMSGLLVLGFPDVEGAVVLRNIDRPVADGTRLF